MTQYNDTGIITLQATGVIPKYSLVKIASGKAAIAGIGEGLIVVGTTLKQAFAADEMIPVRLVNKTGTALVIAAAAIAAGAGIWTAADGEVSVSASTAYPMGIAITAATADQDIIEVMFGAAVSGIVVP